MALLTYNCVLEGSEVVALPLCLKILLWYRVNSGFMLNALNVFVTHLNMFHSLNMVIYVLLCFLSVVLIVSHPESLM